MTAGVFDPETIKSETPISSVVGQVVKLRRAGREWVGLCPFHDDHTPSFYVNDEKGTYYCHGCQAAGDIFQFVMDHERCSFPEAADRITGGSLLGFYSPPEPSIQSKGSDNARLAREVWNSCQPINGTVAAQYLELRGIHSCRLPLSFPLRFGYLKHPKLRGERPALVAAFTDLKGEVCGVQRIFLSPDGRKVSATFPNVDAKMCLGSIAGNAIKLGEDTSDVFITESLEDGLSLWQSAPHLTVWAVAGVGSIPKIRLPENCLRVTIAPDNDRHGRKAIQDAALAFEDAGKVVSELMPAAPFKDWNEQLLAEKRA